MLWCLPYSERVRWLQLHAGSVALVAWVGLIGLAGCTNHPGNEREARTPPSQSGVASWYGPGFHGKKTTSGAIYDQNKLTAAHQTLPLGSRVRVTNLRNRKTVKVLINDRGPFAKGRIIDLSYAAAKRVEMVGPGTAPVLVEVFDDGGHGLTEIPNRLNYTLQVGAFSAMANATELKEQLERRYGGPVSIRNHRGYYRVRLGTFSRRTDAKNYATKLAQAGFTPVIVEKPLQKN
jgi:rare lipoprotein A